MGNATLAARGRLGHAVRRYADQPERIDDARRDLAAAKLEDYIKRTVDAAPSLSVEQRQRLAALLSGGGRGA